MAELVIKTATRNMFYDERGNHVRTKKEILDEAGNIRKRCKVIKKGEIYEKKLFTSKNTRFKQEDFLDEVKLFYTRMINRWVTDEKDRLTVFDRNGPYLATKKIGRNNPKVEQIEQDNKLRMDWNREVDRAIISDVPMDDILQIKREHITEPIKRSIQRYGNKPQRLTLILNMAITELVLLISKVLEAARTIWSKIQHTDVVIADKTDNVIAICDDEVSMVQILEEKIKKLLPDAVIDKYLSGDELIASGSKPDILFLDIQMPGMDGMETAKMLRHDNEDMILIFVTAAEEYVFQAFDVGAFHYLVKPFSDEKLKEVVTKAVHNIKRSFKLEKDEKYIMVQTAGSHIKIFLRDIVYAEVYNRKVIIHTRSTDIEYYGKLQELSDMAGTDFFRTHRAYLVHFKYVEKYDATCVTMKNGTALIAKKNYPEFVKQYLKYNQRKGNEVR